MESSDVSTSVPEFVSNGEFVKIAEVGEIHMGERKRIAVDKRDITVFCAKTNQIYAIDSVCYHTGGPLEEGDIEDVAGRMCIVCPWHRYKIDLCTGEGLFVDLKGKVTSKGKRQRAHPIQIKDDGVYIQVQTEQSTGEKLASDHYAYKELYKGKRGVKMGAIHSKKPPMSL